MNKYYVYKHINTDTNEVFYIGKGSDKRAYDFKSRNFKWLDYINKNKNFKVEIVKDNLTEDVAFELEKELINQIGLNNLTNISEGGPGNSFGKKSKKTERYLFMCNMIDKYVEDENIRQRMKNIVEWNS